MIRHDRSRARPQVLPVEPRSVRGGSGHGADRFRDTRRSCRTVLRPICVPGWLRPAHRGKRYVPRARLTRGNPGLATLCLLQVRVVLHGRRDGAFASYAGSGGWHVC
jgi:hypothetical protein